MARKVPTAEQKAKADARRERFRELVQAVAALTDDERAALVAKLGAIVTCEGRTLSIHNSCLLVTQLPTASMVGGFHQWKAHGRSVKKGEHGLMLWIPTGKGAESEPAATGAGEGTDGDTGKRRGFVMGTVFDITQTETDDERASRSATPDAPECGQCGCASACAERCDVCGSARVPAAV